MLKEALADLQTDYVDLYLLHFPVWFTDKCEVAHKPIHIIWREFEECHDKGWTKNLGVSNMNVQSIGDLLSYCKVRPQVNQVESSPYL